MASDITLFKNNVDIQKIDIKDKKHNTIECLNKLISIFFLKFNNVRINTKIENKKNLSDNTGSKVSSV